MFDMFLESAKAAKVAKAQKPLRFTSPTPTPLPLSPLVCPLLDLKEPKGAKA